MTKMLNFALKIKGGGREGGKCEVLRPCHPQNLKRALTLGCWGRGGGFLNYLTKFGMYIGLCMNFKLQF